MTTVDNRVVHMTFDNKEFERGIAQTMSSMEKMKASLNFSGVKDTFSDISKSASGVNLGGMASAIDNISGKFSAMGAVAFSVINNITSRVVDAGINMAKKFAIGPITDGFHEMETNMNSIQTILANTDSKGTTLDQVNGALDQLNTYSDQTIYNFSQMARNIGTFTAAGVDLDTSVNSIKGIANLAAISGSNADQASTAMYQLSQALASGSVKLMDWNSVVNAGMGGEVFQKALFETGKSLGKIADVPVGESFDDWKKAGNTFRASLESGWLTADVLTNTLQSFTGDLDAAQLKALGYTDEQVTEMMRLGKLGKAAATEVKTLTQLLGTVKESVGSGWTKSFQIVFGDFNEAKTLFTDLNNTIGAFVAKQSDARNALLQGWKDLGGRTLLIEALKDAFKGLATIVKPIKDAFREMFPPLTGKILFDLTQKFADFTKRISISGYTALQLKVIFEGIFSVVQIVIEIVKQAAHMFSELYHALVPGDSGHSVLQFFEDIAVKIQDFKKYLVDDGGIAAFFYQLTRYIKDPMKAFDDLRSYLKYLFDGIDFGSLDGIAEALGRVKDKIYEVLDNMGILDKVKGVFDTIREAVFGIFNNLNIKIPQGLVDFFNLFGNFGVAIDKTTSNSIDLSGGFDRISTAMGFLWDGLKKVWDILGKIVDGIQWAWGQFKDFGDAIGTVFSAIFDFAKNIGPNLQKAFMSDEFDKFLEFLQTVALLLGGKGLHDIGSKGLKIDLTGGSLTELGKFFKGLQDTIPGVKKNIEGLTGVLSDMQLKLKAEALQKIAIAIGILTASLVVLSFIDPDALGKALAAMAIGFGQLVGAFALLDKVGSGAKGSANVAAMAGGLILLSSAMLIMAGAMAIIATLSWEEIGKGLSTISALLLILVGTIKLLDKAGGSASLIGIGLGMAAIGLALNLIASSMLIFASMSWEELGKGMAAVAAALLLIGIAMNAMPASTILIGPGLAAVGLALNLIGTALLIFATMSWKEIGKGMAVLLGSLLILSAALDSMGPSVILIGPGLIGVGIALNFIATALTIMGKMSMKAIGKSLLILTGSLLILSAAMDAMAGALPGAIALGVVAVSLMLLQNVLAAFASMSLKELGMGLLAIVAVIVALGLTAAVIEPIIPALFALGAALALIGVAFALFGVGASLTAEAFQIMAAAGTAGIDVLLYAIDQLMQRLPDMGKQFAQSLIDFAQMILDAAPKLIEGIGKVLAALLDQLILLVPKVEAAAIAYIDALLSVFIASVPKLVEAGFALIMGLLHGIEDNIKEIASTVGNIIVHLVQGLTDRVPDLVQAGIDLLLAFLGGIAAQIDDIVAAGLEIVTQILVGVADGIDDVVDAMFDVIEAVIDGIADRIDDVVESGYGIMESFIEGTVDGITGLAHEVVDGVIEIFESIADETIRLANAAGDILVSFLNGMADAIRTHSSEIRAAGWNIAMAIADGMTGGLASKAGGVAKSAGDMAKGAVGAVGKVFGIGSPSKVMIQYGEWLDEGLAQGMDNSKMAVDSAQAFGDSVVTTLQKSMNQIPDAISNMSEFAPTITPVLDLTGVKTTAGQLNGLLNDNTLGAQVSLDQARIISTNTGQTNQDQTVDPTKDTSPKEVKFEQNIYSPTQLNAATIYKQSRNQIELAKKELAIP